MWRCYCVVEAEVFTGLALSLLRQTEVPAVKCRKYIVRRRKGGRGR